MKLMRIFDLMLGVSIMVVHCGGNCFSQSIDTAKIVTNTKIFFMHENNSFYNKESAVDFLNNNNFKILQAKGFKDMMFVKLIFRGNFQDLREKEIPDSSYVKNRVPFSCDYIIACDVKKKGFFKVKGFMGNDFSGLIDRKYKPNEKEDFMSNYAVEELDIECLFEALILGKKKEEYPCLKSCKVRDKQFSKIEVN